MSSLVSILTVCYISLKGCDMFNTYDHIGTHVHKYICMCMHVFVSIAKQNMFIQCICLI